MIYYKFVNLSKRQRFATSRLISHRIFSQPSTIEHSSSIFAIGSHVINLYATVIISKFIKDILGRNVLYIKKLIEKYNGLRNR